MALPFRANDKTFGGIPGVLFRDLVELDIGKHSLKDRRKLLWSIHCWINAENPVEDKIPEGSKTLDELRRINDQDLKFLKSLRLKIDEDVA